MLLGDRKIENFPKLLGNNGQIKFPVFLVQVSNYVSLPPTLPPAFTQAALPTERPTSCSFAASARPPADDSPGRDQNKERRPTLYIFDLQTPFKDFPFE